MIRKFIKELIYSNNLLFKLYYKLLWSSKCELDDFLIKISKNNLKFIQIGANDGKWNDPIYKFIRMDDWQGILVEPQNDIFERLVNNYNNSKNLVFENCAIGPKNGEMDLYRISFTNSKWASGLSSFNKEDVQRMIDAGYVERNALADKITPPKEKSDWITTEKVKVVSFETLITKHKIQDIDLLMLDVEGYEFEILKCIPFENINIKHIVYEHSHFNENVKSEISSFLKNKGYLITLAESDSIATKQAQ